MISQRKKRKLSGIKMMFDFIRKSSKAVLFCLLFKFDIADYIQHVVSVAELARILRHSIL